MIPEAAVEAALKEWGARGGLSPEAIIRTILEAAAPFMLASAWEAGYLVAKEAIRQLDPINPYEAAK